MEDKKTIEDNDQEQDDIIKTQDAESSGVEPEKTDPESYEDCPRWNLSKKSCSSILDFKKTFKEGELNLYNENEEHEAQTRTIIEKSPKGRFLCYNKELGSGAQKKVYLAYDTDKGREVAWNKINVSLMNNDSISKIKEEIEIMKRLQHPNIISFISGFYNEDNKELVILTELFSGGSLKQYLSNFPKPRLRVIKHWATEILQGIKYLHELTPPIIHRDIKCDNIFVNKDNGTVKIGDLGFSCMLKTEYAKTFSGTVEFCSPEMYYGKYGVKADIYSFGMCLLEMVTYERPYKECEGNIMAICEKATKQIPPLSIEKIKNSRLKDFIKDCLKAENDRPDANELLQSQFLNDLTSEENDYPALGNRVHLNEPTRKSYLMSEYEPNSLHGIQSCKGNDLIIQLNYEEINNMKIAHILFLKKQTGKTIKIQFDFVFDTDTVEGVVNELQKAISLTDEEAKIVNTKINININKLRQTLIQSKCKEKEKERDIEKNKDKEKDLEKEKEKDKEIEDINNNINELPVLLNKFDKKYDKCIQEAQDILSSFKNLKDLKPNEQEDFANKIALLEKLIKLK